MPMTFGQGISGARARREGAGCFAYGLQLPEEPALQEFIALEGGPVNAGVTFDGGDGVQDIP